MSPQRVHIDPLHQDGATGGQPQRLARCSRLAHARRAAKKNHPHTHGVTVERASQLGVFGRPEPAKTTCVESIGNLAFQLTEKAAWRGTESLGEGCAEDCLADLRTSATQLL